MWISIGQRRKPVDYKKIMLESARKMIERKAFEDITVQMILDDCKISRSTFYRYFRDKYDLIGQYYTDYVFSLWKEERCTTWLSYLQCVFAFLKENRKYFLKVFEISGDNSFWNSLYDYSFDVTKAALLIVEKDTELSKEQEYSIRNYVVGQIHISRQWLQDDCPLPVEKMAEFAYSLTPKNFLDYFAKTSHSEIMDFIENM